MADEKGAAFAHYGPYIHFASFANVIKLDDHKLHFRIYPRSFLGETAQTALVEMSRCDREDALEFLSIYISAHLVQDCEKPKDLEARTRHVYTITYKGELVMKDFASGRIPSQDNPELVYTGPERPLRTNIIYIERDGEGKMKVGPNVTGLIVRLLLGERPNLVRKSGDNDNDGMGSTNNLAASPGQDGAGAGLITIKPILLRDRLIRLRSYSHAFSGVELIDWIVLNTSCLSRDEANSIASSLLTGQFISGLGGESATSPTGNIVKDSKSSAYQPTIIGCKTAGWNPETEGPSSVRNAAKKGKLNIATNGGSNSFTTGSTGDNDGSAENEGEEGRSPDTLDAGTGTSVRNSVRNSYTRPIAGADAAALAGVGSSLSPTSAAGAAFEWEVCHLSPISMNGTEARLSRGSQSSDAGNVGSVTATAASITAAARQKRASTIGVGRSSAVDRRASATSPGGDPQRRVSEVVGGAASPRMDGPEMTFSVDQVKESNPSRLIQILTTEELRTAFHLFVRSIFCEENLYFWEDVHAFRTLYSTTTVVPGMALPQGAPSKQDPLMIPHAMALYLKYIVTDAPYEVNVNITIKKVIESVMALTTPFLQFIDPESIAPEEKIIPSRILFPGAAEATNGVPNAALLAKFPETIEKLTASLFDAAEHHIFILMANDSVPKFIRSPSYAEIMTELFMSGRIAWKSGEMDGLLVNSNGFSVSTGRGNSGVMTGDGADGGSISGGALGLQRRSSSRRGRPVIEVAESNDDAVPMVGRRRSSMLADGHMLANFRLPDATSVAPTVLEGAEGLSSGRIAAGGVGEELQKVMKSLDGGLNVSKVEGKAEKVASETRMAPSTHTEMSS
ncbi:hypothetical protein HK101_003278 [Irineochytrium annulatum]|nr:hypothetical protein HK101_003278 [Irineochytrium annulatum]